MMGMGTMEILVILLVSFILLGPQKMIEASRMLGKAVGQMRRIVQEIPRVELADLEPEAKKNPYEGSPIIDEFNEGHRLAGEENSQDQLNVSGSSKLAYAFNSTQRFSIMERVRRNRSHCARPCGWE